MKTKAINLFVLIIGGIIIFNLSQNIVRLWQKRGQIAEEEQKLEGLRTQNSELRTRLEYVQSEEFIEKEAREKLGWAKEGEEVWVLPEVIRDIKESNDTEGIEEENWRQWVELFFPNSKAYD